MNGDSNISNITEIMKPWIERARAAGLIDERGMDIARVKESAEAETLIYRSSLKSKDGSVFALLKVAGFSLDGPPFSWNRALAVFRPAGFADSGAMNGFEGEVLDLLGEAAEEGVEALFGPLSHRNAVALRRALPYTAPSPLGDQEVTIGVGDRLGVASAGHLRVMRSFSACPVLAQQSVRELELTGRDYEQVLDAATWAVFQEGYGRLWGADGDHLKTEDWVRTALSVGFTMITADVSDFIDKEYADKSAVEVLKAYEQLPESYRQRIETLYLSRVIDLDTGEQIRFSRETLARVSLVYRRALEQAERLYKAGVEEAGEGRFDFELSVDETETPTTAQAHAFVALEAAEMGIKISSLAPRFVGEFQKGIDYIGDTGEFERTLTTHAALARKLGYRISVHSGSDKFSVFPIVGKRTEQHFHLKTAGTSWLEAVKVIAEQEPELYRRLHSAALERFSKATVYYVVTTDLDNVPGLDGLADSELPGLFDNRDARQLIHITYGELLSDKDLGRQFFTALDKHIERYWQALERHIGRHLEELSVARA